VLNLNVLANILQIIQKVPTPTSFDLSTAADMLLWSSYIKKGYLEKKYLIIVYTALFIYLINNLLISSWCSEHVTFYCWNGANHSVNLAKHISSMCLCSDFRISGQLLISKMNLLLMILPLYYFTWEFWATIFPNNGAGTPTGSWTESHVHASGKLCWRWSWINWSRATMLKQWIFFWTSTDRLFWYPSRMHAFKLFYPFLFKLFYPFLK